MGDSHEDVVAQDVTAEQIVTDRMHDYGHPEQNFAAIADGWVWYIRHKFGINIALDVDDVPAMMRIVKESRLMNGYHADSVNDIGGYALTQHMLHPEPAKEIEWTSES